MKKRLIALSLTFLLWISLIVSDIPDAQSKLNKEFSPKLQGMIIGGQPQQPPSLTKKSTLPPPPPPPPLPPPSSENLPKVKESTIIIRTAEKKSPCLVSSLTWSLSEATPGQEVLMAATGNPSCDKFLVSFSIFRGDTLIETLPGQFYTTTAQVAWTVPSNPSERTTVLTKIKSLLFGKKKTFSTYTFSTPASPDSDTSLPLTSTSLIVEDSQQSLSIFQALEPEKVAKPVHLKVEMKDREGKILPIDLNLYDRENNYIQKLASGKAETFSTFDGDTFDAKADISENSAVLDNIQIETLEIVNLNTDVENHILLFDYVPLDALEDRPKEGTWRKIYAIDPAGAHFEEARITVRATGSILYKCKDWHFANRQCLGTWEKIADIQPGQPYTITVSQTDPAFGEGSPGLCSNGQDDDGDEAIDDEDGDGIETCYTLGEIYYVSSSIGNDAWNGLFPINTGGSNGPKSTLSAANSIINNNLAPGDHILFKRGDTFDGSLGVLVVQGTQVDQVVIGAYGAGERPRIVTQTSSQEAFRIRSSITEASSWIIVKDLHLTTIVPHGSATNGLSAGYIGEGFFPAQPHHIILSNMRIAGNNAGITNYADYFTLENSILMDNWGPGGNGIYTQASYTTLINNIFNRNGEYGNVFPHQAYMSHSHYALVEGNTFSNSTDSVKLRVGTGAVIRNNTFFDLLTAGIIMGGDDTPGSCNNDVNMLENVLVEGNVWRNTPGIKIRSQSGAGIGCGTRNLTLRNNLVYNESGGCCALLELGSDAVNGIYIYNNAFDNAPYNRVMSISNGFSTPQNVVIRNNIFSNRYSLGSAREIVMISDPLILPGISLDYNEYYTDNPLISIFRVGRTSYSSLTLFQTAYSTQEVNGIEGDPLWVNPANNDYHLQTGSPAIDAGAPVPVPNDIEGTPRPQGAGWDLGAYEFSAGSPTNQAPTVNAGPDQTITLPTNQVNLDGTVTDDGLPNPPGIATSLWTQQSGPGTVIFGAATAVDTTATFSQAGTYVLRLTADDSALTSFDELTVTVTTITIPRINRPPVLAPVGNSAALEGELLQIVLDATDPDNDTLTYSSSNLPSGATLLGQAFTWRPDFGQAGSYPLRFIVTDNGNPPLSDSEDIIILIGQSLDRDGDGVHDILDCNDFSNQTGQCQGCAVCSDPAGVNGTCIGDNNACGTIQCPPSYCGFGSCNLTQVALFNPTQQLACTVVGNLGNCASRCTPISCQDQPACLLDDDGDGVPNIMDRCPNTPLGTPVNRYNGCPMPFATIFDPNLTTNFSEVYDLHAVGDLHLGIRDKGQIQFVGRTFSLLNYNTAALYHEPLNLNTISIDHNNITIETNGTNNLTIFDQPATLLLYNLSFINPHILRGGVVCTVCTIISYTSGTLEFTVPGFSSYSAGESPSESSGGSGGGGGGSGGSNNLRVIIDLDAHTQQTVIVYKGSRITVKYQGQEYGIRLTKATSEQATLVLRATTYILPLHAQSRIDLGGDGKYIRVEFLELHGNKVTLTFSTIISKPTSSSLLTNLPLPQQKQQQTEHGETPETLSLLPQETARSSFWIRGSMVTFALILIFCWRFIYLKRD